MSNLTDKYPNADELNIQVQNYNTPYQPYILATEVLEELEKRLGSGKQYTTFPNKISDEEKAKVEAAGYIVTRNTIDAKNLDGSGDVYIGFQVAVNETAASGDRPMVISQEETNGIEGGGGGGGTGDYNALSNKPQINGNVLTGNKTAANLGLQETISDIETIRSGASAGATAVQPSALSDYQTKLSGTNKLDPAYIEYDATHRAVTDTEKSTWNGKQSALTTEQLAAVNSGIDSADVAQIETNKNNIAWNTNNGVKNIINNTAAASTENAGITWTKNADGSMTGNGTCTGTSGVRVVGTYGVHTYAAAKSIPKGTYVVAPTGKTRPNERFTLYLWSDSGATAQVVTIDTSAYEFTVTNDTTKYDFSVGFSGSNVQITNDTLYPMICLKSLYDSDNSYQPYARTNRELTVAEDEDRAALIEQVDEGAKNIANWTANTQIINNVKFVVENGIVIVSLTSGTNPTARSQLGLPVTFQDDLETGTYVLSGAPKVTAGGLYLWDNTAGARVTPTSDTGNGTVFTFNYDKTHTYNITVDIGTGYSIPSGTYLVFKPMICTAADWAVSQKFVPYALPNPVLTPALIEQVDSGAKNLVAWDIPTVRSLNTNATWTSDDTCVKGGITYKFNTDGTVVANGTADTSGSKYIKLKSNFSVAKGLIASCGLPTVSQDQSKGLLQLDYQSGSGLNVYDYEISKEVDRDGTVELYITVLGGITVSNLIFKPMICTTADWAVSQKFVPYAMSNAELTADMSEVQTGLGAVCVLRKIRNSSATYTYTMSIDDFTVPPSVSMGSCGTYLISIITWSTTPTYSMYTVSYTGGNTTDYNLVQKIAGADANVTCTNGVITVTSSGKVQIYALR